jgi:hypothetical protein
MRIRNWFVGATLAVAALELAGCSAASQEPTPREVVVQTPDAPGAECTLTSPAIGTKTVVTPGSVNVVGQDAVSVTCHKECFQDGSTIVPPDAKDATVTLTATPKCKDKAAKTKTKKKKTTT